MDSYNKHPEIETTDDYLPKVLPSDEAIADELLKTALAVTRQVSSYLDIEGASLKPSEFLLKHIPMTFKLMVDRRAFLDGLRKPVEEDTQDAPFEDAFTFTPSNYVSKTLADFEADFEPSSDEDLQQREGDI